MPKQAPKPNAEFRGRAGKYVRLIVVNLRRLGRLAGKYDYTDEEVDTVEAVLENESRKAIQKLNNRNASETVNIWEE